MTKPSTEKAAPPSAQCTGPFADARDCPIHRKDVMGEAEPPSAGALRAAQEIMQRMVSTFPECDFYTDIGWEHPIAAIISRETGNRELLEALDNAILIFGNDQHSGPKFFNGENSAIARMKNAIAKASQHPHQISAIL
jgi:hypothetical protein